jgi:hypothetical protein
MRCQVERQDIFHVQLAQLIAQGGSENNPFDDHITITRFDPFANGSTLMNRVYLNWPLTAELSLQSLHFQRLIHSDFFILAFMFNWLLSD